MNPELNTVFVLGAGFSIEQGYPLASSIRQLILSFLGSERNRWHGFLEPWNGGIREGQFFAGLRMIEGQEELPFEELLIKISERLKQGDEGPLCITNKQFRIGTWRVLWEIHNSIEKIKPAYRNFATRLRANWHRHGIISFNWDLLAEQMLHQESVPWHYNLTAQGRLPVIKPHGSINWNKHRRAGLSSPYPYWSSIGGTSLSFDAQNPLLDHRLDDVGLDLYFMLFPGDSDQPDSDGDMNLLWRDAACLMDRTERVVFIGYSFPDYDHVSREFFGEAVRGKKIVVINPSKDDLQKSKRLLGAVVGGLELRDETFRDCEYAKAATRA